MNLEKNTRMQCKIQYDEKQTTNRKLFYQQEYDMVNDLAKKVGKKLK